MGIADARPGFSTSYSYDALDRLTAVSGFGAASFSYDAQGNRLTKLGGPSPVSYSYHGGTNRLASITGAPEAATFQYDDVGNVTCDRWTGAVCDPTGSSFAYNTRNQMVSATAFGHVIQWETSQILDQLDFQRSTIRQSDTYPAAPA